jgi:hypothetical protein
VRNGAPATDVIRVEEADPLPLRLNLLAPARPPFPGRLGRLLVGLVALEFLALLALIAFVVVPTHESEGFQARKTLLAETDLPPGWVPVPANTYPFMTDSPVVNLLLDQDTEAGAFSAYRDPTDSSAVATYVVYRPEEPVTLEGEPRGEQLPLLALLVSDMERLARQQLDGSLPEVSFAVTDVPVSGALRGRSLAPPVGDGVQSDFIVFSTGSALALVVVEQPRGQEPFRSVEDLASIVHSRLLEELG